jgi:hypothetical protein
MGEGVESPPTSERSDARSQNAGHSRLGLSRIEYGTPTPTLKFFFHSFINSFFSLLFIMPPKKNPFNILPAIQKSFDKFAKDITADTRDLIEGTAEWFREMGFNTYRPDRRRRR